MWLSNDSMYCTSTQQNGLGASLATSVLFLLAKSAVSRARRGSVCLPCVPSLQIYLPYDILGIFIPFVYVLDPLRDRDRLGGFTYLKIWKLARRLTLPFSWQTPNGMMTSPNGNAKFLLFRQTCMGKKLFNLMHS